MSDKVRIEDFKEGDGDNLSLAMNYLIRTKEAHKIDFKYMTEDDKAWYFLIEYQHKWDKRKTVKYITIPVLKENHQIGIPIERED